MGLERIKSTKSTIVEGYGRRRYKLDYVRFLTYSLASCDETTDHLETLYETESLKDEVLYKNLYERLQILGKKINRFIQSVEAEHRTDQRCLVTGILYPASARSSELI